MLQTLPIKFIINSFPRETACEHPLQVVFCATCDGAFFKNTDVAVVGGGSTALTDAVFLAKYCRKVYLVHRRNEFRGEIRLVEALKKLDNVEFILNYVPYKLVGTDSLKSFEVRNTIDGSIKNLDVRGVFVAVGQIPDNEIFKDLIELDENGYIAAGEDCKTSVPGIYAAGDCRTKTVRQLTTATADGTVAAVNACEFIF